jgi:hypothetical protein
MANTWKRWMCRPPLLSCGRDLIKLDSPGPVLFVQKRFGFYNEVIGVLSGQYETIRASLA